MKRLFRPDPRLLHYKARLKMLQGLVLVVIGLENLTLAGDVVLTGKKMEILEKGQRVVFSGGAEIKDSLTRISAETIVHHKVDNQLEARNNVRIHYLLKSSAAVDFWGWESSYNLNKRSGYLLGNPAMFTYLPVNFENEINLQCGRIDFALEQEEVAGESMVVVRSQDAEIRADFFQGSFSKFNSYLRFSTVPEKKVETISSYGDYNLQFYSRQLDFYPEKRQVRFRGEVVTKIIPR